LEVSLAARLLTSSSFFLVVAHVIGLIGIATYLHGIEQDDYINKHYAD
jgi:hypothetical protein